MSSVVVYRPLAVLEEKIAKGKEAFLEVAAAFLEIHEGKLYREAGYATFELYCQHRWGISRDMGQKYLSMGKVVQNVAPVLPPGKAPGQMQARALAPLKAEQQRELVKEIDLGTATVADVKAAVRKKLGKPEPPPKLARQPATLYEPDDPVEPLAGEPTAPEKSKPIGLLPPRYEPDDPVDDIPPIALKPPKPRPTDVILAVTAADVPNGRTSSFLPFRLFAGFLHLAVSRDGRGFSTLAVWKEQGKVRKEEHFHDTDTAALAWVAGWLAAHQAGTPA